MKKPRTFAQRWNPTALRRIRKELTLPESNDHLCNCSPAFAKLWNAHHQDIKALASQYTFKHCYVSEPWSNCLFKPTNEIDYQTWLTMRKQVRIDFLTNEINRLTKKP